MDCSPAGSSVHGDSPGKNTGVGCHALLQRIFPKAFPKRCYQELPLWTNHFWPCVLVLGRGTLFGIWRETSLHCSPLLAGTATPRPQAGTTQKGILHVSYLPLPTPSPPHPDPWEAAFPLRTTEPPNPCHTLRVASEAVS